MSVVVCAGAAIAIWQWNNLSAARVLLTTSEEEIQTQLTQNEEELAESINEILPAPIFDLTEEEKQQMASNEISAEEAVRRIVERTQTNKPENSAPPTNKPDVKEEPASTETAKEDAKEEIKEESPSAKPDTQADTKEEPETALIALMAEIYVLRADFVNQLESLKQTAIAEYTSFTPEELSTQKKAEWGMKYIKIASQMESQCDQRMNGLVAKIETELQNENKDMSILNEIKSSYAQEKTLQKAAYMAQYSKN